MIINLRYEMNKSEIINTIAAKSGLSKRGSEEFLKN